MKNTETIEYITNCLLKEYPDLMDAHSAGPNLTVEKLKNYIKYHKLDFQITPFNYQEIISVICNKLALHPENYEAIAFCLNKKYTDEDLLNITNEEVYQMIIKLDNYTDNGNMLDNDLLDAVIAIWIQLRNNDYENDSQWDAYI